MVWRATQGILIWLFPPFVAGFSHLKRALRHFKPVNGSALCAVCLAFRAVIKQIDPAPDNVQMRADSFTLSSSELPPLSPAGRGVQFGAGKALEPLLHTQGSCADGSDGGGS